MLPLQGVRVVDLSTVVFGPLASQILGDYGATVIKVEPPEGDSTRRTGPQREAGMAAVFLGCNRNKRSVVLDLREAPARQALHQLIATADVFMHSMRPQKLAKLGLEPSALTARFPRLVYAGLHGFGECGPYAGRPAYDDVIQGMSGTADLVLQQTGQARYLPMVAADKMCAHVAAHAVLAALLRRARTGRGGFVEIPMFESMVGFNLVEHLYGQHFEPPLSPAGYPRAMAASRKPYATADGYVAMMPYTDVHWQRLFAHVGQPQLAHDARFCGMAERTQHIDVLLALLAGWVAGQSSAHWLAVCAQLEIPAAPIAALSELKDDPHLQATGFFEEVQDARMGTLRFPASPVRLDGQRLPIRTPPRLGEHTRQCLQEAGVAQELMDVLCPQPSEVAAGNAPRNQ